MINLATLSMELFAKDVVLNLQFEFSFVVLLVYSYITRCDVCGLPLLSNLTIKLCSSVEQLCCLHA